MRILSEDFPKVKGTEAKRLLKQKWDAIELVAKCHAALILAPGLRHRDVASAAKTLMEAGLTDVQFARLEPSMSDEIRLAASA